MHPIVIDRESPSGDYGITRSPAEAYDGRTPRDRSVVDHSKPSFERAFKADLASPNNAVKDCNEINAKSESTSHDADDNLIAQTDDKLTIQADDTLQSASEDGIKMKENNQKDILINMTLAQAQQNNKAMDDDDIAQDLLTAESVIMQEFKYVFDEHVKDKERFDEMIAKRDQDISEQIRELDKLLESLKAERSEIEKVIGESADTQKRHTHFKYEASKARVENIQQAISSEILFQDNAELRIEAKLLQDDIADMKKINDKGLNELNKESHDSKCAAGILKNTNDTFEAEIKSKVEEFNQLKIETMDRGITYITKRKPVQIDETSSEFPRAERPTSPAIATASSDKPSSKPLRDRYEDQLLSLAESKINNSFEKVRKEYRSLSKDESPCGPADVSGIKKIEDDCMGNSNKDIEVHLKTKKQNYFENEAFTLSVNDVSSKIPRPIVQSYGSASRYGERFLVTKNNSLAVIESDKYKRDNFVPDVERHVTKPTMDYINPKTELRKLNGKFEPENERYDPLYQREIQEANYRKVEPKLPRIKKKEIKSKIDTGLGTNVSKRIDTTKETNKNEMIPKPPKTKKTEIKSRIGTGLRNRPCKVANDRNKQNNEHKRELIRPGQNVAVNNDKTILPPIKNLSKTENDLLQKSSRSLGEKAQLPVIKQNPDMRMNGNIRKSNEYEINKKELLPPITRADSNLQRLSPSLNDQTSRSCIDRLQPLPVIASEQRQHLQQETKINQTQESLRLPFTPTPPSTPCTNRRRKRSARGEKSPDSSRVPTERA